ncbi:hypothetical protein Poli38472_002679 [Pythium oligandrum]|uniref:TKL protein kinase n=1 Tax=Pythium oligandrum TaxID=41045 RepID=A0A8K1CIU4_PYTOL|nr:hypothetical protein Poli38472_002679 [Pythium oligandrum]|eukprot:TMW63738.1 hypothetical protein Poli38472_002679 [Pythium oligandrum]
MATPQDATWWEARVHFDEDFVFDGTHSDFAQQFYRRFLAGDTLPALDPVTLPQAIQDHVRKQLDGTDASGLVTFASLSPLLQRALLWDVGVVQAGDLGYVQVYTQCGLRMSELAVPLASFQRQGCTEQTCSTPNGEIFHQSMYCSGYQMGNASRCATTNGKSPVHSSMWSDGGEDFTLPETEVAKHEWQEWNDTSLKYTIYAIHLKGDPNSYGKCQLPSMTVPCVAYKDADKDKWCLPEPSKLVRQWFQAEVSLVTTKSASSGTNVALYVILALLLVVLALAFYWFVYRKRRKQKDDTPTRKSEDTSYFFTGERSEPDVAVLGGSFSEEKARFKKKHSRAPVKPAAFGDDSFRHNEADYMTTRGEGYGYPLMDADSLMNTNDISTGSTVCDMSLTGTTGSVGSGHGSSRLGVLGDLQEDPVVSKKRVPFVDVSMMRRISKGAFGEIWLGRMRDQLVAVKRLVPERRSNMKELQIFIAEIQLMAKFDHPNVMSLLGVAWNSPENLCMTMDYMEHGDLQNLLEKHGPTQLTWTQGECEKTSIAIDIAEGLRYMHSLKPKVVHRDLKSKNVLLGDGLHAKLCDFGVSRMNEGMETMTCGVGTAYWTAPEVLVGDRYTESADVYSFGVVLAELDTHQLPYFDAIDQVTGQKMEAIRIMHLSCMGELTPTMTTECPSEIRDLAKQCMTLEARDRPAMVEILARLTGFLERCRSEQRITIPASESDAEYEDEDEDTFTIGPQGFLELVTTQRSMGSASDITDDSSQSHIVFDDSSRSDLVVDEEEGDWEYFRVPEHNKQDPMASAEYEVDYEALGLSFERFEAFKTVFQRLDRTKTGTITTKQFPALCYELGDELDPEELVVAIASLENEKTGLIHFSTFLPWWISE